MLNKDLSSQITDVMGTIQVIKPRIKLHERKYQKLKNVNMDLLMENIDFHSIEILDSTDLDTLLTEFNGKIAETLDKCAPEKQ